MNIIIFINSLAAGGAERVTVNLANFWVKRGWSVKIVTLSSPNLDFYWIDPKVKRASLGSFLKGNYFFSRFINNLHRILLLRCLIHKDQPKIALSMMSTANILLAFSGFFLRGPVLIGSERIHPPSQPMNHVWEFLRKYAYKYLAGIVALTEESKMWLIQNTRARCIRVIPNIASYPLVELHPRVELPESLRGKKILLSVGRLEKQKGYDVLIDIFKSFSNRFSDWYLVILGEGPERVSLQSKLCDLNLNDRVLMLGRSGNIGEWYGMSDIYVLSSRFEGFPNTLVEAMAHGLPVVSFDCETGPSEIIRHGVDGFLASNNDVVMMENYLIRLMSDEKLRQQFSRRAFEVRSRYSEENILKKWDQLFYDLGS